MEDLFREILAPSPTLPAASLPSPTTEVAAAIPQVVGASVHTESLDWEGEAEMQRLLDMLPDVQPDSKMMDLKMDAVDFASTIELWDMAAAVQPPPSLASIGVF